MAFNVQRLTLIALVQAIEEDLQGVIVQKIIPGLCGKPALSPEEENKFLRRAEADEKLSEAQNDFETLLHYADFGDCIQIINRNKSTLDATSSKFFIENTKRFSELVPVRNRLMHGRPLEFEDFPIVTNCADFLAKSRNISFDSVKDVIKRLEGDKSFLTEMKVFIQKEEGPILHNLPFPDFDDTGFLGREELRQNVRKAIYGRWPVITLSGPGGNGKTALALKAAYDLLEEPNNPFEAIVWVSAKTQRLTVKEIERIEGAICDSLGLLGEAGRFLGGSHGAETSPMQEVMGYLASFKILLVLDNLETVLDNNLRSFIRDIPDGSKVLITSRVAVGGGDFPIEVGGLTHADAARYFRSLARSYQVSDLIKLPKEQLDRYVSRLQGSPLFIKWFISAVRAKQRPEQIITDPKILLQYCLSNVYEHLSDTAKDVVSALVSVPGLHGQAMIAYLTDLDGPEVQRSLLELMSANFIDMRQNEGASESESLGGESVYTVTPLARMYIERYLAPSSEKQANFIRKARQIRSTSEEMFGDYKRNPYNINNICLRHKTDLLVARILQNVFERTYRQDHEGAQRLISQAKELSPGYFEVSRVEAFLHVRSGNFVAAKNAYEVAVELAPGHAPLRFWFGGFLMNKVDAFDEAIEQFEAGVSLESSNANFLVELARAYFFKRQFDKAKVCIDKAFACALSNERFMKKLHDTNIQYFMRYSEALLKDQNHLECLNNMLSLLEAFDQIPKEFRDIKHIKTLEKSERIASQLASSMKSGARSEEAEMVLHEICKHIGKEPEKLKYRLRGTVEKVLYDKGFGFLFDEKGDRRFFRKSSIRAPLSWESMASGLMVSLMPSNNEQGPTAVDIEALES
ncbi:hypothetical protein GAY28_05900 [Azospirillum brasilense]|nr:hypothetical protein [Azospirillum brasilense]